MKKLFFLFFGMIPLSGYCVFEFYWEVQQPNFCGDSQPIVVEGRTLSDVSKVMMIAMNAGEDVRNYRESDILFYSIDKSKPNPPLDPPSKGFQDYGFGAYGGQGLFTDPNYKATADKNYYIAAQDSKGNIFISNPLNINDKEYVNPQNPQLYPHLLFTEDGLVSKGWAEDSQPSAQPGDAWRPSSYIDENGTKRPLAYQHSITDSFYWAHAVPEPAIALSLLLGTCALLLRRRPPVGLC